MQNTLHWNFTVSKNNEFVKCSVQRLNSRMRCHYQNFTTGLQDSSLEAVFNMFIKLQS